MKKFLLILACFTCFLSVPLKSYCETTCNEDLIELFCLASETGDVNLINDVVQAILDQENSNEILLDALARYNEKGKIDFALHNAIKDKNILASVILAHYSKDVNTSKGKEYCNGAHNVRDAKTPVELALEADMKGLIPYLLMKGAGPYRMRQVSFVFEEEENLDYLKEFGYVLVKKTCMKTKKVFYELPPYYKRTLIGDAIVGNRLDVIKMLDKAKVDWNKSCFNFCNAPNLKPLQLSLAIQRYDIAQFLIDHGARIE